MTKNTNTNLEIVVNSDGFEIAGGNPTRRRLIISGNSYDLSDSDTPNYYVTTDGSDSNDGKTWGKAFATLGAAIGAINGGVSGATPTNNKGTVYVGDGTFTISSTITVTRLQSVIGQGAARTIFEVSANAPGILYTGVYPEVTPYSTTNYPNTGLKGFTIRPSGAANTDTAGIKIQDIVFPQITDVFANGFTGVRGVGIWVFNKELPDGANPGGFVERLQLKQVATDNNTYGILLDRLVAGQPNGINDYRTDQVGYGGYGNTSTNADNSVMYHTWEGVSVNARAVASGGNAQIGIQIQKGVQFYHSSIGIQFNITGVNGANTVAPIAMNVQNSSAVNSGDFVIRGEASGTAAWSVVIDDSSTIDCVGLLDFLYSSSFSAAIIGLYTINGVSATHNGNFKFSGGVNGYGLTNNTTQATKPIHTILEKTTLASAVNTAPPNGPALRVATGLLDSTHPAFDFLRITNQRFGLNSFDGTNTLTYLQVLQDITKPIIQFPQGLRVMSGSNMYSGSGAPSVTGSVAGDYYLRTDAASNRAQMLYAATGVNTWVPMATYDPTNGISDVNGNRIAGFTAVSGAVNYVNLQNNTTGNAVVVGAAGSDSSINMIFKPKGTIGEVVFRPDTGGDSAHAIKFNNAGSTVTVLDIDTSNGRVGIGNVAPTSELDVTGKVTAATLKVTTSPTAGYVLTAADGTGNATWQAATSGPTVTRSINQASHGLVVGNLVRHNGTIYVKSQADSASNSEVFGIVSAVADANNFSLTTHGYVTGLSGLSAGGVFYLDPVTAGTLTGTEPTTSGQVSKPAILANSTTSGYFVNYRGRVIGGLDTYNTNGLLTQTATGTFTGRTMIGTTNQVTVTNGDGVSGNPTLSLPQDIATTSSPTFGGMVLTKAFSTTVAPLTITPTGTLTSNTLLLLLNSDRPWQLRQQGTGASANLELNSTNDAKSFVVTSANGATALTVAVNNTASSSTVTVAGSLVSGTYTPLTTATYNIGSGSLRWGTVFAGSLNLSNASAITLAAASNMVLDTVTGTKIGTATTQKLAFYNSTPIVQPTGNALTALSNLGLIGTPTLAKADVSLGNVDNTSDATKNSATATLTNKRVTPRIGTTTSSATPTINTDNVDFYSITALAADITSFTTNLSGTPTDGQKLWVAITGTATRAIAWGASFEASTVALPTTTVSTNRLDVGFIWNAVTSKWRCMAAG